MNKAIEFKEYHSKPVTRTAYRIRDTDPYVTKVEGKESTFQLQVGPSTVQFKAYEQVKSGDYIVYLNHTDIYHCSSKVFEERNIV